MPGVPGAWGGEWGTGLSLCPLQGIQASEELHAVSLETYREKNIQE